MKKDLFEIFEEANPEELEGILKGIEAERPMHYQTEQSVNKGYPKPENLQKLIDYFE